MVAPRVELPPHFTAPASPDQSSAWVSVCLEFHILTVSRWGSRRVPGFFQAPKWITDSKLGLDVNVCLCVCMVP